MSSLSTHVLNTATGQPAAGLNIMLEKQADAQAWKDYCQDRLSGRESHKPEWEAVAKGVTNQDGRCPALFPEGSYLEPGIYRMDFDTAAYFAQNNTQSFYPLVQVIFEIQANDEHYHVPLLLSPYGFSTYRGS